MTDSLHLRHRDADLDRFAARITDLLQADPPCLVDISGHDERCDRIDLRVHDLHDRTGDASAT